MCEFISWIEKDGRILFLTDKEIFSSHGKERLEGCRDNDFLGHGAIRKFFAPPDSAISVMLEGGTDKEQQNFWNTETLPKQITELLKTPQDFEKHWGKTFESFFQNNDLCYIIERAPKPYKEKAAEQLLKQKPSSNDLYYIIKYVSESYKEKAWEQLLKQRIDNDDLRYIIEHALEPYKEKAWEQLLKQKPDNYDLRWIIEFASEIYKGKAWEQLLKQKLDNDDLYWIIKYAPEPHKSRARKILNQR